MLYFFQGLQIILKEPEPPPEIFLTKRLYLLYCLDMNLIIRIIRSYDPKLSFQLFNKSLKRFMSSLEDSLINSAIHLSYVGLFI